MKKRVLVVFVLVCLALSTAASAETHLLWDIPFQCTIEECAKKVFDATGIVLEADESEVWLKSSKKQDVSFLGRNAEFTFHFNEGKMDAANINFHDKGDVAFARDSVPYRESEFMEDAIEDACDLYGATLKTLVEKYGPVTGGNFVVSKGTGGNMTYDYPRNENGLDVELIKSAIKEERQVLVISFIGNIHVKLDSLSSTYSFVNVGITFRTEPSYPDYCTFSQDSLGPYLTYEKEINVGL